MLPLTFADPNDYTKIGSRDKISIVGLPPKEGVDLTVKGEKPDGKTYEIKVKHTYNGNQLTWFNAGSALNAMKNANAAAAM